MIPTIIIPNPSAGQKQTAQTREEFLRSWHEEYDAGKETIRPPENIRFWHDEWWRERAVSIQFIHAVRTGTAKFGIGWVFWSAIGLLFGLGQFAFWFAFVPARTR